MPILTIARLTLREASRRKLVIAVAILTLIVGALSAWAFHRLLQTATCGTYPDEHPCSAASLKVIASALLILLGFMFSFILALGAAFIAAPSVANEIESGIALAILPRPIRRSDVLLGKWLGLAVLLVLYASVACAMEFTLSRLALGYVPPHPVLTVVFIVSEAVVVLTLTLAGSTRLPAITCGIVVFVLFGMSWIAGVAGGVGAALHNASVQHIGTVGSLILPTDGLWRGAIYNMEPVAAVAAAADLREAQVNPFFVASPPTTAYLVWATCWVLAVMGIAIWSFSRREL